MARQTAKSKARQAEQDAAEKSPRLLTKEQVALKLQLSTRTVYRKWQEGEMPAPIKLGSVIRWRSDVIDDWIENDCQFVRQ